MTIEAQALLPRIETILADIRGVESVARRGRSAMEGRFRLGIIPTIAPYLLPHVLPDLKARFPTLVLELREAVTGSLAEETAAGRRAAPPSRKSAPREPAASRRQVPRPARNAGSGPAPRNIPSDGR
jgi:DNA-binding transcriptional LysR family regulator